MFGLCLCKKYEIKCVGIKKLNDKKLGVWLKNFKIK